MGAHLHPFRPINPGVGGEKGMDARDVSLTAVFASLYAIIVVVQSSFFRPSAYSPIQLRVADCLIPLSILFGWPVVAGVTIGGFMANMYYIGDVYPWLGIYDVVLGPVANLIAASLIFALRKQRLLACITGAFPIGLIVGGYLWLLPEFFLRPDIFGLSLPIWAAVIISITMSSLIAIAVIGYILVRILGRPAVIQPLKSRGLKVVE